MKRVISLAMAIIMSLLLISCSATEPGTTTEPTQIETEPTVAQEDPAADGVLDVLPSEHQEKLMKDIILEHPTDNPKELADYILSRVQQYKNGRFSDDMTILAMGVWKR